MINPDSVFSDVSQELCEVWKYPPKPEALARSLKRWCKGVPERALWLVKQQDDFTEYPGPEVLARMIRNQFEPTGENQPYQRPERQSNACSHCGGCGYIRRFTLVTVERPREGSVFTRVETLTEQQFDLFNGGKLDPQKQRVYSGVAKCECGQSGSRMMPMTQAERDEHDAEWDQFLKDWKGGKFGKNKSQLAGHVIGALRQEGQPEPPKRQPKPMREPGDESEYDEVAAPEESFS